MNPIGLYFQLRRRYAYWNTFRAYQLMDWGGDQGKAHDAELALFEAFFTRRKNVSDTRVLRRHLVTGAQGEAKYARILRQLEAAQAATTPLKLYATW